MKNIKGYYNHLLKQGKAANTAKANKNIAKAYLRFVPDIPPSYQTVMDYIKHCKEEGNQIRTISQKITALTQYFDYLDLGENPAKAVQLKGQAYQIPTQLLSKNQLKGVYELQTTGGLTQKRAKVLLSLVVFQGVGSRELGAIEVADLNLQEGTIYIPKSRTVNSRQLELKPHQLLLMQDYLLKVRPTMLKEIGKSTELLLFSMGKGKNINLLDNVISIMLRKLRILSPKLKSLQQIRQSVITNWIEEYGLRKAQYMAGHRYVSSTERYKKDQVEGLRNELNKYFPL